MQMAAVRYRFPVAGTRRRVAAAFLIPVLAASVAATGCDVLTADLKHTETAEWRKTYDLAANGHVEVSNVNGKIVVEPSTGNTVEVIALKTARAATPDAAKQALERIEIRDESSSGNIKIETKVQRTGSWFD